MIEPDLGGLMAVGACEQDSERFSRVSMFGGSLRTYWM